MSKESVKESPFFSSNIVFINELYQKFLQNPASVDASWAEFFSRNQEELKSIVGDYSGPSWARRGVKIVGSSDPEAKKDSAKKSSLSKGETDISLRLTELALAYRRFGHLAAQLDPLGLTPVEYVSEIDPKSHGIEEGDMDINVEFQGWRGTVGEIIKYFDFLYCGKVGCEFEYLRNPQEKKFLIDENEEAHNEPLSREEKLKVLKEVIRTERFEQFLHKRFPGAKRFSIEGGDATIPAIEKIIDVVAQGGVKKMVIGMAHRGRLNTLTGIMGKPYHQMISEFKGTPGILKSITRLGDVKYHMGYSSTRKIKENEIELSLAFNPSHLEAVNPVVCGRVRATQDILSDASRTQAIALLIHGDAAFAGQGSVAENLVMNGTSAYDTGGVIHIIINNQIGFTANPDDSRSTTYASDLARAIDAPIFHVNGDDVEAVVKTAGIIARYRQLFKKDVVLDLICYRRYGHNEGDEPLYTQPVMYGKIKSHPSLEKIYSQRLISEGAVSEEEYQKLAADFDAHLSKEFDIAQTYQPKDADWLKSHWSKIKHGDNSIIKTAIDKKTLKNLIAKIVEIPSGFNANPKVVKQLEARKEAVESERNIDWGCGEALAFASLLEEGFPIRITGQDSGRGTFSHRHAVLHDAQNGKRHNIFSVFANKAKFEVYDSVLSEYGVLGFEYGYSLTQPYGLTIWEAQFGDFANGAQIVFDQFIASSEMKWLRKSGLVMLLPHGYEGQGPEHSSARLERYLQACADDNLRVVNITNPANFFHALRRQLIGQDRKPLVVMSPKSLLRHKLAVSTLGEFSDANFQTILPEASKIKDARKVVLCSGKVYYDLFEAREAKKVDDVAIIRLEQLYPFPKEELKAELKKYKNAEVIWCQEEPRNMGAWKFVEELIEEVLVEIKQKISRPKYAGRISAASPATGYAIYHAEEQKKLIDEALS